MAELFYSKFFFISILFFLEEILTAPNLNRECSIPPIQNGLLIHSFSNSFTKLPHNSRVYITCDNGYTIEGSPGIVCQNGTWSNPFLKCQPKKCNSPLILNAIISGKETDTGFVEHGDSLNISCKNGYELKGSNRSTCLLGKWNPEPPTCDPKSCPPVRIPNGVVVYQGNSLQPSFQIAHNQQILISCNKGYKISEGKLDINCQFGQWSVPIPHCQPESCNPRFISNGRILVLGRDVEPHESIKHGLILSVICASDYVIHGEGLLTCNKGKWSHHFPTCKPKFCLTSNLTNGKNFCEGQELKDKVQINHDSKILVKCDPGYFLLGSGIRTCSYGHWLHSNPQCLPQGCHAETVLHGSVSYLEKELTNACSISSEDGLVSHQHSVTVSCLDGFQVKGAEILTCHLGNWSEKFPTCQPRSCHVQTVLNGKVMSSSGVQISTASHFDKVSLVCNHGYEISKGHQMQTIHCFYGNWTGNFSSCVARSCFPNFVPHGRVHFGGAELNFSKENLNALYIPHDHHVTVGCDPGFNLTGSPKLKCIKGQWSKVFPKCQPSGCPIHLVKNGVVKESGSAPPLSEWGQILLHGQKINIACKTGYTLEGVSNLKCLFGNWSAGSPACIPKSCPVIPVKNSHIANGGNTSFYFVKHNAFHEFTCEPGFNLIGLKKIKCFEGVWRSEVPTCQPDKCNLQKVVNGVLRINKKDVQMKQQFVSHNTTLTIECQPGFDLVGIPNVRCLKGKWSSEFPSCQGSGCKAITKSNKVQVFLNTENNLKSMSIICDSKTHFPVDNITHVECHNNRWVPRVPKCQPKSCQIPSLPNGFYKYYGNRLQPGDLILHGERIYASCMPGYHTIGAFYSYCKYGEFSYSSKIECKEDHCSAPSKNKNHTLSILGKNEDGHWLHGTQVSISCPVGHTPKEEIETATCILGHWSPATLDCGPKSCILPQLNNGYFLFRNHWPIRDKQLHHGTFIAAFCESSFQITGEKLIGCYYGNWIPQIPTCENRFCPSLTQSQISPLVFNLPADRAVQSSNDSQAKYPHGSIAQLKCDSSKYRPIRNVDQSVCHFGRWSVDSLQCEPIPCLPLVNDSNTKITIDNAYADHIPHNSVAYLHCDESRFTPLGHQRRAICEFGQWYPQKLQCKPRQCEIPDSRETHYRLLNGEAFEGEYVPSGSHINAVCEKKHLGVTLALCYQGQWVPPLPSCFDGSCLIHDVHFDYWRDIESKRTSHENYVSNKTQVLVQCENGYRLTQKREYVFSCLNGRWSPQEPTCEQVFCYIPGDLLPFIQEHEEHLVDQKTHLVKEGTALTIICPSYSQTKYPVVTKCKENSWQPILPNCTVDAHLLKEKSLEPNVQSKNDGLHCKQPLRGDNVIFHWDIESAKPKNFSKVPHGIGFYAHCSDVGKFQLVGSIRLMCRNGIWSGTLPFCQKTEEDEKAPPRISILTVETGSGQQKDPSITINGSVKVTAGVRLELRCQHRMYEANSLEWLTADHMSYSNFRTSLKKDLEQNTTVAHLGFHEVARKYSGRYTCRIRNTTLFHFVDLIIF